MLKFVQRITFNFIMFNLILLFIVPNYIFGDNLNGDTKIPRRKLVYITHQDKIAKAMCFYDKYFMMNSVYFKGPSEILIKAGTYRNGDITGDITFFEYIDSNGKKHKLRFALSDIHHRQGFELPAMVDINGVFLAEYINLNDGGISSQKFNAKIKKKFKMLPNEFKMGLREFYLFGSKSIIGLTVVTVYLGSIFRDIYQPFEVYTQRIAKNEIETIQNFLSEINYCPSEKLLDIKTMTKKPDYAKHYKIKNRDKVLDVLYNRKSNLEEFIFNSSNGKKMKIYLTRGLFPGNLIKFVYKEKGYEYIIEQFIFSNFFKNKFGIPIVYGINKKYIAGILDNKKHELEYKLKKKNEIKNLPIGLQKRFEEFLEYCIKTLCEKEILNFKYKEFFGTKLNKKKIYSKIESIASIILKTRMINDFEKIYGEYK